MEVLVTGGAGYIGSHTCLELLNTGYNVTVLDNLSNSKKESLNRIQKLTGKSITFYKTDINDKPGLQAIFGKHSFDAVIHFAGLKAVGESVHQPARYYQNNVSGSLVLFAVMQEFSVKTIVFSSSATVYGDPASTPIKEDFPIQPVNPYGQTKWMIEQILQDIYHADPTWNVAILRYFNPVGAHSSGEIGEDPSDIPNNLFPYISQVAVGKLPKLNVFGNDYATPDGTGIRDYIHVVDLAIGHIKALDQLKTNPGLVVYNLGTGHGYTVLEIIRTFESVSSKKIPYQITPRRAGDAATSYADPGKANRELEWKAERTLEQMCLDTWNWQKKNPAGY